MCPFSKLHYGIYCMKHSYDIPWYFRCSSSTLFIDLMKLSGVDLMRGTKSQAFENLVLLTVLFS